MLCLFDPISNFFRSWRKPTSEPSGNVVSEIPSTSVPENALPTSQSNDNGVSEIPSTSIPENALRNPTSQTRDNSVSVPQSSYLKSNASPARTKRSKRRARTRNQISTPIPINTPQHCQTTAAQSNEEDPLLKAIKEDMWIKNSPESIKWTDIAGLENAKRALQEAVILPLLRPDFYTGLRSPPKGILLYGPPGTGKTMLAKAAASQSKSQFFACSASSLTSKWHGESEKLLKTLFQFAMEVSPSIVFFDEIDALLSRRKSDEHAASRRFKTEFMIQVDGVVKTSSSEQQNKVLILGCTNCPWDLDDAVIRRFQRRIYVPLPDPPARKALLEILLQQNANSLTPKDLDNLVSITDGYSCSDLKNIGRDAAFRPMRSLGDMDAIIAGKGDIRPISFKDFENAVESSGRSVSAVLLRRYAAWENDQAGR